ncbi:UNVERIFIED_CONTAM: hypothetical protein K2H54_020420 [Gekko kuhli]
MEILSSDINEQSIPEEQGPVCSACVSAFGARPVTIFSGFMVAGGLMMSSFAPNIYFLLFSYGILVGLGCGLLYTATVTITCQYFEKRRGLALGLISTGSSVGLFIYAALQRKLIELYGLEGCLLIVGALSLNILACGSLMRPLRLCGSSLPEKSCLEKIPDQYSIYNEKEKHLYEENVNILEKASTEEKSMSKPPSGDWVLGFLTGNWSIFPYVTTKTVGIEKLAHAYGILMFFAGLGNSLGPPIVGWIYDWTKSYDTAFYFSGLCVLFGGLLLLVAALPCWSGRNQPEKPLPSIYSYKVSATA